MPKPRPLPPGLPQQFTVAEARAAGLSHRRLRALDLDRSFWGIRAAARVTELRQRCALLQLRLPERAFFSHSTAALLLGVPVPLRFERDPQLQVSVPAPTRALVAQGVRGHRVSVTPSEIGVVHGLRLTSPERTWCDLAEQVPFADLVAAGDFLIHWRRPLTSVEALTRAITERTSRRGRRNLARAIGRLNNRSESPPESHLRLLLEDAGLPPPRINHVVSDRFGEFVARTDFSFEEYNLVIEYQGDYHRTSKGQWRADMTRRSRLESLNLRVLELNADDLRNPAELVARIRAFARLR